MEWIKIIKKKNCMSLSMHKRIENVNSWANFSMVNGFLELNTE